jgi:hypothetical protein
MIKTIITHPGGSHKDDLLAVCVLISKYAAPVERREPTTAELDDPTVAIVDIGGRHEPALSNFDHHHFPREHPPTCALSLLLDHLGLYEDALLFCDWLEPAEWFDSRGPKKTAEWLNVPRKAISQLNSPIDITLLRRFARETTLAAGHPIYEFMRLVGDDLLDYLADVRAQLAFVDAHVERWSIAHADGPVDALFLPRTDPPAAEPSSAVARYVRAQQLEDVVQVIVYPDRRGAGFGIARYEDHPRFDFSRAGGEPDVHFAHKSGFMCKTSTTVPDRLKAIILKAIVPADT